VPIASNDINTNFYDDVAFVGNTGFLFFSKTFAQEETTALKEQLAYFTVPIKQPKPFGRNHISALMS